MRLGAIRGHAAVRRLLARAVARDRLPPSLVLSGPDGVGKRQVAVGLAELLNCEAVRDAGAGVPESCGACPPCRRIARGVHADVLAVAPGDTGTIKVDAVRGVVEQAAYRPFEGRRRVVIVDDADRLVAEAQNALLKTLEEPPPASVFLLVTHRPHLLLPTVRSRCPELRFGSLAPDEVVDVLVGECGVAPPAAPAVAAAADGSVARALEAGSDEYLQAREPAAAALRALAAAPPPKRRLEAGKDLVGPRRAKSSPATDREAVTRRLRALGTLFRDLQVVYRPTETGRGWRTPTWRISSRRCRGPMARNGPGGGSRPWIARWRRWRGTPVRASSSTG
ncbi:MAG: DNA polymerase III subunit [Acidobacteria bacterium]|nr:DNA polymerase III subunit [Acidobacteriota bacterium]